MKNVFTFYKKIIAIIFLAIGLLWLVLFASNQHVKPTLLTDIIVPTDKYYVPTYPRVLQEFKLSSKVKNDISVTVDASGNSTGILNHKNLYFVQAEEAAKEIGLTSEYKLLLDLYIENVPRSEVDNYVTCAASTFEEYPEMLRAVPEELQKEELEWFYTFHDSNSSNYNHIIIKTKSKYYFY